MPKKDTKTKVSKADQLVEDIKKSLLDAGNINNNPDWEGWSTMLKTVREADIASPSTALGMLKQVDEMVQEKLEAYKTQQVDTAVALISAAAAQKEAAATVEQDKVLRQREDELEKATRERSELEFKFKRAHKEALLDKDDIINKQRKTIEELEERNEDSAKTILKGVLDDIAKSSRRDLHYISAKKEGKNWKYYDYIIEDKELVATFKRLAKNRGHI